MIHNKSKGRHCSMWCSISCQQLKIPKNIRESDNDINITLRSLDTLKKCYDEFTTKSDGNLKKAKFHNNVIGRAFFDIPLQVCPPRLHITLGVFQRLFNLLEEEECHLLDKHITEPCDTTTITNSFDQYLKRKEVLQALEEERATLNTESKQAHQILLLLLLSCQDPHHNLQVQNVANLMTTNTKRISIIVSHKNLKTPSTTTFKQEKEIEQQKTKMIKGFEKEDMIFVKCLDQALATFNVERQAYDGGSIIGNHIHRALKVKQFHTEM